LEVHAKDTSAHVIEVEIANTIEQNVEVNTTVTLGVEEISCNTVQIETAGEASNEAVQIDTSLFTKDSTTKPAKVKATVSIARQVRVQIQTSCRISKINISRIRIPAKNATCQHSTEEASEGTRGGKDQIANGTARLSSCWAVSRSLSSWLAAMASAIRVVTSLLARRPSICLLMTGFSASWRRASLTTSLFAMKASELP
jgi:hypothetical protein